MDRKCQHCQYDYLNSEIVTFDENSIIFFADAKLDYVYQVVEVFVKMVRYLENGEEKIIGIMGAGDYLALLASLKSQPAYLATAISLSKTVLKRITNSEIQSSYQRSDKFRSRCLDCAVTRSHNFQKFLVLSANTDIKDRILNTFAILFEKFGYRDNKIQIINLPFSKTVLANIINVRRETLSRALSSLKNQGIIDFEKNKYILNYVI